MRCKPEYFFVVIVSYVEVIPVSDGAAPSAVSATVGAVPILGTVNVIAGFAGSAARVTASNAGRPENVDVLNIDRCDGNTMPVFVAAESSAARIV